MRTKGQIGALPVQRPSVTAAIVYLGLCSIWFLWILLTGRHATLASEEPQRLITLGQYAILSVANLVLLVALVLDALRSRESPPGLRRGHFAGITLGAVAVILVQVVGSLAFGPSRAGRARRPSDGDGEPRGPSSEALFAAPRLHRVGGRRHLELGR